MVFKLRKFVPNLFLKNIYATDIRTRQTYAAITY